MDEKGTGKVPDAWEDDDYGKQADRAPPDPSPEPQVPLTKKERLAQHAELNRKLWESAEEPQGPMQYLSQAPPLAQPFKGPMKVLSRKPQKIAKRDPVTGLESLTLDDNSDDEKDKQPQETPAERQARQQRELMEKQKRYNEARAKLFGPDDGNSSGGNGGKGGSGKSSGNTTPGTVTPPRGGGEGRRGRGRGRGFRSDRGKAGDFQRPMSRSGGTGNGREMGLYDPNYSPRPGSTNTFEKRTSQSREEEQTIRAPRGPDDGKRGGFGFARRGVKKGLMDRSYIL